MMTMTTLARGKGMLAKFNTQAKRLQSGLKPLKHPPKLTFATPIKTSLGEVSQASVKIPVVGHKAWRTFWKTGLIDTGDTEMYHRLRTGASKNKSEAAHIQSRIQNEKQKHQKGFEAFLKHAPQRPTSRYELQQAQLDYMMQHPTTRQGLLRQIDVGSPVTEVHPDKKSYRYRVSKTPVSGEEAIVYFLNGVASKQGQQPPPRVLKLYPKGENPQLVEKARRELALKSQFPNYVLPHSSYTGYTPQWHKKETSPTAMAGLQEVIPSGYQLGSDLKLSELKQAYGKIGEHHRRFKGGFNHTTDLTPSGFAYNPTTQQVKLLDITGDTSRSNIITSIGPFTRLGFSDDDLRGYLRSENQFI